MLTEQEIRQAKLYATGDWAVLRHEPETGITTYVRREDTGTNGYRLRFREVQDATTILKGNEEARKNWTGWKDKPHGASVSAVPIVQWNKFLRDCGYDGEEYDRKKMKKILNDGDYSKFRTGGGRL